MRSIGKASVLSALLVFSASCADLDVVNENDADAARALRTPSDIESLIAGSYRQWWIGASTAGGYFGPAMSNMAWQHSGWPANFGVVYFSSMPRPATTNDRTADFYGNIVGTWNQSYRALSAIAAGLRSIEESEEIQSSLGAQAVARVTAYAKFVQGLSHGAIALLYDQGFIIDENTAVFDENGQVILQEPVDRHAMLDAALGFFDDAIALSSGQTWPAIPSSWMSVSVSADQLALLASSMKARYRAAAARTPAERAAVDWSAVVQDIDNGVASDWKMNVPRGGNPWTLAFFNQYFSPAWQQLSYQLAGMADQSGTYQKWLDIPPGDRLPDIDGEPFLIHTPDTRFPQGADIAEQRANPGTLYDIPASLGNHFRLPGRGTYRWSYYWAKTMRDWDAGNGMYPVVSKAEMDLLKAEALYRLAGNQMTAEAAALVNRTRMAAGLDDISDGVNDSCVPRLWQGECGDFFEALKWEKRLETIFSPGLYLAPWYLEGRGWGDLYRYTPLQLPAPCLEMQLMGAACVNYGGIGGEMAAPTSIYAWPHEG
jgi:hypothetical protein